MRSYNVDRIETKEKDIVLNDEHGFPYIYIGRGSYCSDLIGNSLYEDPKKVHLIYIGRYTAIARNLKIYCDFNHAYKALYVGVIPDFENEYLTDVRQLFGQEILPGRLEHAFLKRHVKIFLRYPGGNLMGRL